MIRKILQDVIPPDKKSIRHIPLPGGRKPLVMEQVKEAPDSDEKPKPRQKRQKRKFNFSRWSLSAVAILLLIAVFLALSWYFASATLTIKPKQSTAAVNTVLESSADTSATLVHTVITATSSASEVIASDKEEDVQRKASGQIVVYNNYSSESQRLIKNTRFEASNGNIYRIDSSVVVPGQKIEGGKKVPGSATVTVYADVAGPEYNLSIAELKGDFTIPGFKGSPRFQAFYARQKTDITGGFSGRARVVDDSTLDAVENRLKTRLSEENWVSLNSSLPSKYILFKNLYSINFNISTKDNPSGDGVLVEVVAVGKTAAFEKVNLSTLVATKSLLDYDDTQPVLIQNLSDLNIISKETNLEDVLSGKKPLTLEIKGNVQFVWQFDEFTLKKDLVGRRKGDTDPILRKYTAIEKASVIVKPTWRSKYPSDPKRIHIVLKLD